MLEALAPTSATESDEPSKILPERIANGSPDSENNLETDLVGTWRAEVDDSVIELVIDETAQFRCTAKGSGQATVKLAGNVVGDADALEIITSDQRILAGNVPSRGTDAWIFGINSSPPNDPVLVFETVR